MNESGIKFGLRVDVDTLRGTEKGVPALLEALGEHDVRASFFFSAGPDNMGRNIYRLLRPGFLWKMLRSGAPSLYGWDILLKGTLWPGPIIARRCAGIIREAAQRGHETGLHAWDHFLWQNRLDKMSEQELETQFQKAYELLAESAGVKPVASANPAWRSTNAALRIKEKYGFLYNSDCRGEFMFLPLIDGKPGSIPQIPVTLPTFDEMIGRGGVTRENFNREIISLIRPGRLNVYTIHAEVEGITCLDMFNHLLDELKEREIQAVPLGEFVASARKPLPECSIEERKIQGRDGKVAMPITEERPGN